MRYYQFEDESKTLIVGSYAGPQSSQNGAGPYEQLEDSDPRVVEFLGPEWTRRKHQTFSIESIDDLVGLYKLTAGFSPSFYFRGQEDSSWEIQSRIERQSSEWIKDVGHLDKFELRVLSEAQRRAHLYFGDLPPKDDTASWLSLIRHHGAPTRIIDITSSIFVAAYFACSKEPQKDAAIWAFGPAYFPNSDHALTLELIQKKHSLFYKKTLLVDSYVSPFPSDGARQEPMIVTAEDLFLDGRLDYGLVVQLALQGVLNLRSVLHIVPSWVNKRIDAQKGSFLLPLDMKYSGHQNILMGNEFCPVDSTENQISYLLANLKYRRNLQEMEFGKIIIKAPAKREILGFLEAANCGTLNLFPDIEGFMGFLSNMVPT